MKKILIIGSNGAGKSTFSYRLSEMLGLPLIHIDQVYWHSNWQVTPKSELQSTLLAEAQKPSWIIEGNNLDTLHQRLQYADTVFWFEFPPIVCVINILRREFKYRGKVRPDMPDECISKIDFKFMKSAWGFNKKNHSRINQELNKYNNINLIRFTRYYEVKKFLRNL